VSHNSTFQLLRGVVRGPAGFLFLLTFLVTFGFSALEQTFSFYLLAKSSFGVTGPRQPLYSGALLGLAGLIGVIIQGGLIGSLVARFGEGNIARAGILLMVVGFALFPLPASVLGLALGPMLLLSAGRALTAPALSSLISNKARLGQGLTLSTSQSFDSLARTVGPVTAGALFNYFGPATPYFVSSVVMAGGLLVALAKRDEMVLPQNSVPTGEIA
jgi:MFS family permease